MSKTDGQNANEWVAAQATVISIKKRLLPWSIGDGNGLNFPLPNYTVTFSYVVGARVFTEKYTTTAPAQCGQAFEILYDPAHPNRNTGLDEPINPWIKWAARVTGVGATVTAIWLWGDKDWFQN